MQFSYCVLSAMRVVFECYPVFGKIELIALFLLLTFTE